MLQPSEVPRRVKGLGKPLTGGSSATGANSFDVAQTWD